MSAEQLTIESGTDTYTLSAVRGGWRVVRETTPVRGSSAHFTQAATTPRLHLHLLSGHLPAPQAKETLRTFVTSAQTVLRLVAPLTQQQRQQLDAFLEATAHRTTSPP